MNISGITTKIPLRAWPTRPLAQIPGRTGAIDLATLIYSLAYETGPDAVAPDLREICKAARAQVRTARLGGAEGMRQAMLIPLDDDRFSIAVDPVPVGGWAAMPKQTQVSLRRQRLRFRIGHELAHTLTYWRLGGRPRRHLFDSPKQETFCDIFSSFLMIPPVAAVGTPVTVDGLLSLQRKYDVSLRVAAQVLADLHPSFTIALWYGDSKGGLRQQWSSRALPQSEGKKCLMAAEAGSKTTTWLSERHQLVLVDERP